MRTNRSLDDLLEQRRRVDKTKRSVAIGGCLSDVVMIFAARADHRAADSLTGQGKGLAPAGADDRMGQAGQRRRHGSPVVNQLGIRFVGEHIDGSFSCQQRRVQRAQHGLRIQFAGRVVRSIDDQSLGPGGNGPTDGVQVGQKRFRIILDDNRDTAMVVDVGQVFEKKRGQDHHFIPWIEQGFEHDVQPASRTDRHADMVGCDIQTRILAVKTGDRAAGGQVTVVAHVTVHTRRRIGS